MESGRLDLLQIAGSSTTKMGASKASTENWTERFQDLQSWCHQPPQDELHTPQINDHDEFNFSVDVANVKDLDGESFVDTDPWGTTDLFDTSCLKLEENNNNENFVETKDLFNNVMFSSTAPTNMKSPLKPSSENIMLTQTTQSPNFKSYGTIQSDYVMDQNVFNNLIDISNIKNQASFKVPRMEGNKERRKLKLNIAAATSSKASLLSTLSTPDVLKPVTEVQGEFDLVEFVDPGEDFEDFLSESHEVDSVENDHNYTSPKSTDFQCIKSEPLSPPQIPEDEMVMTTESGRKVKRPRKTSESDFVFDSDDLSDDSFTPTPKKKKTMTRRTSIRSEASSYDPSDKYRELRDRNNEASRKSRQHRKERDEQMRKEEKALEKLNRQLKVRTKRMEELVYTMRAYNLNYARSRNQL